MKSRLCETPPRMEPIQQDCNHRQLFRPYWDCPRLQSCNLVCHYSVPTLVRYLFCRMNKILALIWLPFVAGCRMTKFVKEEGVSLQNHVIATVNAADPIKCRWHCVDTQMCFSINVRKLPTGRVTCELNNSSKTADPQDLIPSAGSQYHQMAVSWSLPVSKYQFSLNNIFYISKISFRICWFISTILSSWCWIL